MKKKILAWALLVCMLATLLPVSSFAEGTIAEEAEAPVGEELAPPADAEEATDPVILSESEESQEDPAEPVGADAPGGPEAAEEATDPVILRSDSDEESQSVAEPEEEILRSAQDDTEEAPAADVDYISLTEEEFAAQSSPAADGTQAIVDSGTCGGNLTWELDDAGTLTISGTGAMWDYTWDTTPWTAVREEIVKIIINDGVSSIGTAAFGGCTNLKNLYLPTSVLKIASAFGNCANLTDVYYGGTFRDRIAVDAGWDSVAYGEDEYHEIPLNTAFFSAKWHYADGEVLVMSGVCGDTLWWKIDEVGTFTILGSGEMWNYGWEDDGVPWPGKQIKKIVIENGVTSLGKYAFYACNADSITIPLSLISVPYECFYYCSKSIDAYFCGTPTQKKELESGWSFSGPPGYGVDLIWHYTGAEDGWDYCGDTVFWSFDEESGTLRIKGDGQTWNFRSEPGRPHGNSPWEAIADNINSVFIENGVTGIGDYSFYRCAALKDIRFPDSLTTIGSYALEECSALTSVVIPADTVSLGSSAFMNCTSLCEIILPEHAVSVGSSAFENCRTLEDFDFSGVTEIWYRAFYGCSKLREAEFSDSLNRIMESAFASCGRLETVTLPVSVTQIGKNAFNDCFSIKRVYYGGSEQQKDGLLGNEWAVTGNGDLFRAAWFYNGMRPGWQTIDGKTYYYDESGNAATGWQQIDGKWYYFNADGTPKTGWLKSGSAWFYMNADGVMQTGWVKVSGTWYYMDVDGMMQTGWQKIDGTWYYFESSGAMVTGWKQVSGKWYYFNTSGAMVTGWQKIGSTWYYFETGGAMVTGWKQISGKWYYFNASGAMLTGWQKIGSTWYHFASGGAMDTGWLKSGSKWYYFESSGAMLANTSRKIGSKTYYFNASGVCTNP